MEEEVEWPSSVQSDHIGNTHFYTLCKLKGSTKDHAILHNQALPPEAGR